jgi:hypothetical protein
MRAKNLAPAILSRAGTMVWLSHTDPLWRSSLSIDSRARGRQRDPLGPPQGRRRRFHFREIRFGAAAIAASPNFFGRREAYHAPDILEHDIGEEFLKGFISSRHTVQEKMAIQVPG